MIMQAIGFGFNKMNQTLNKLRVDTEVRDYSKEAAFETLLGKFKTKVRCTVNHGPDAPLWTQKEHWEERFWDIIEKKQSEAETAIQEEKMQKVLNIKLLHEINQFRLMANLSVCPNIPPRDQYSEHQAEKELKHKEEAEKTDSSGTIGDDADMIQLSQHLV